MYVVLWKNTKNDFFISSLLFYAYGRLQIIKKEGEGKENHYYFMQKPTIKWKILKMLIIMVTYSNVFQQIHWHN